MLKAQTDILALLGTFKRQLMSTQLRLTTLTLSSNLADGKYCTWLVWRQRLVHWGTYRRTLRASRFRLYGSCVHLLSNTCASERSNQKILSYQINPSAKQLTCQELTILRASMSFTIQINFYSALSIIACISKEHVHRVLATENIILPFETRAWKVLGSYLQGWFWLEGA